MIYKNIKGYLIMIFGYIFKFLLYSLLTILAYHIIVFLLGLIPVNKDFEQTPGGIEIFVGTNGVHTDIILPVKTEIFNWRETVPQKDFISVDTTYSYVSIGWGDKGFYIKTPTWSDLTFGTAFKALFLPSDAAMHVTYIRNPPINTERYVSVLLSEDQYQKLINYIIPYFQKTDNGSVILIPDSGYGNNDNFYEAYDSYNLFNTSNNWTNRALRKTGVRTALWSPLDKPIMLQLRKIE